jgi:CheY-like chemotaxis protein
MGQGGTRSKTVLIVDDSDDLRELMVFQLKRLGYETAEAANGMEAIEVAKKTAPSLILMDINMPLLDGLMATKVIREYGQLSATPIVAFSAYVDSSNHQRALAAGCNEYVNKTDCVEQLKTILSRFAPLQ